jgi:hypothetical protein
MQNDARRHRPHFLTTEDVPVHNEWSYRIQIDILENLPHSVWLCRPGLKSQTVRGVARWYRGGSLAPQPFLTWFLVFVVTVLLPANPPWPFPRLPLLSCEFCVPRHELCRLIGGYPTFSRWYSKLTWIFVLLDLLLASFSHTLLLSPIFSRDIPATWSVSELAPTADVKRYYVLFKLMWMGLLASGIAYQRDDSIIG